MVAESLAFTVFVIVILAEALHARRTRRVSLLAFGPRAKPSPWARSASYLRLFSLTALAWGLATLLMIQPKVHRALAVDTEKLRHLVLVLDVSPSMRLQDAGPTTKQARNKRVADLLESFFARAPEPFRISVVATYNGAKSVVIDTLDMEVVRNILDDLPMHYAFDVGETKLFDGLKSASELAHDWNPNSASLMMLSDGDTVPATGIPRMPSSITQVLIVGVGDPRVGSFIDGRNSRQNVSTLRQIANRLGGIYHNGNEHQISTDTLLLVTQPVEGGAFERLTRREYALLACALGSLVYGLLPVLLARFGTSWRPGFRSTSSGNHPERRAFNDGRRTSAEPEFSKPALESVS